MALVLVESKCPECGKIYKDAAHLGMHRRFAHGIKGQREDLRRGTRGKFQCTRCPKKFQSQMGLSIHQRLAHSMVGKWKQERAMGTGKAKCERCGKKFKNANGLAMHMAKAHGVPGTWRENRPQGRPSVDINVNRIAALKARGLSWTAIEEKTGTPRESARRAWYNHNAKMAKRAKYQPKERHSTTQVPPREIEKVVQLKAKGLTWPEVAAKAGITVSTAKNRYYNRNKHAYYQASKQPQPTNGNGRRLDPAAMGEGFYGRISDSNITNRNAEEGIIYAAGYLEGWLAQHADPLGLSQATFTRRVAELLYAKSSGQVLGAEHQVSDLQRHPS
jgi:uncharacterized C2H2 Zn-finger protein